MADIQINLEGEDRSFSPTQRKAQAEMKKTRAETRALDKQMELLAREMAGGAKATERERLELRKLAIEARKASKEIRDAGTQMKQQSATGVDLAGTIKSIGAAYIGVAGIRAFGQFMSESIDLAQKQEQAELSLANAIGESDSAFLRFAQGLQASLGIRDEVTIQMGAMLAQFGVAPDKLQKATMAANDMAAALGVDVNQAARQIAKTMGGFAGELGEVIPELKALTREQLQAGAAIDLLSKKFSGAAAASIPDSVKAANRLSSAWGDFKEVIGKAVIPEVTALTEALAGLLETADSRFSRLGAEGGLDALNQELTARRSNLFLIQEEQGALDARITSMRKVFANETDIAPLLARREAIARQIETHEKAILEIEKQRAPLVRQFVSADAALLAGLEGKATRKVAPKATASAAVPGSAAAKPRAAGGGRDRFIAAQQEAERERREELEFQRDLAQIDADGRERRQKALEDGLTKARETRKKFFEQQIEQAEAMEQAMLGLGIQAGTAFVDGIVGAIRGEEGAFAGALRGILGAGGTALGLFLSGGNPLGGQAGGAIGGFLGGLFHSGGVVGHRYAHDGLAVSGMGRQVPINALEGEVVVSPQGVRRNFGTPENADRALNRGGGGMGGVTIVVNAMDGPSVEDSLRRGSLGVAIDRAVRGRRGIAGQAMGGR